MGKCLGSVGEGVFRRELPVGSETDTVSGGLAQAVAILSVVVATWVNGLDSDASISRQNTDFHMGDAEVAGVG
jgi:hypothetical protein